MKMARTRTPKDQVIARLRRIEGQVRGLVRMVEEDRYCVDILHQVQATKAALGKAETLLLRTHAGACVDDALKSGTLQAKRKKIVELVELFERVR